jgi:hypothetical protein
MILLLNYYVSIKRQYDLQTFFEEHDYLKVSSIVKHAGLNPGLVRQFGKAIQLWSKTSFSRTGEKN